MLKKCFKWWEREKGWFFELSSAQFLFPCFDSHFYKISPIRTKTEVLYKGQTNNKGRKNLEV